MKHLIKKLFSLVLIMVMTLSVTGCSGSEAASAAKLPGVYELTGMRYADEEELIPDFEQLALVGELTLEEDGTGVLKVFGNNNELTYNTEAKTITIDNADYEYTFADNKIEFSTDGTFVYIFEKKA